MTEPVVIVLTPRLEVAFAISAVALLCAAYSFGFVLGMWTS